MHAKDNVLRSIQTVFWQTQSHSRILSGRTQTTSKLQPQLQTLDKRHIIPLYGQRLYANSESYWNLGPLGSLQLQ